MKGKRDTRPDDATPEAESFLQNVPGGPEQSRLMDAPAIEIPVTGGTLRVYRVSRSK